MQIAGDEILLPTMMVGNYPKPRWFTGQVWSEIPAGRYAADSISFEAFSDAILAIVHDQESAGLDVICHAAQPVAPAGRLGASAPASPPWVVRAHSYHSALFWGTGGHAAPVDGWCG